MEMEVRSNRTLIGRLTSYVEGEVSLLLHNLHIVNPLSTDDKCACHQLALEDELCVTKIRGIGGSGQV